LFASLEGGKEGRGLKKMKQKVKEMENIVREGFGGLIFLHNTKLSSFR